MNPTKQNPRVNVNAAIVQEKHLLVIEFKDETGIHYNLPGGGVNLGESLEGALIRECLEEANAEISVGRVLLIWEYVPEIHGTKYGPTQKVGHIFECQLKDGSTPSLPKNPDLNQIGVKWIPLSSLNQMPSNDHHPLYPTVAPELIQSLKNPVSPIYVISRA